MRRIHIIAALAAIATFSYPSFGQVKVDRVVFEFREQSGLLKPKYRNLKIVMTGGGTEATVKVTTDKTSMQEQMKIAQEVSEQLAHAKNLVDTINVVTHPRFSVENDTTYFISIEEFNAIGNLLLSVKTEEVSKSLDFAGHDGNTSEVEFGSLSNTIKYKVWSVTYHTKERGLETLLKAMNQILVQAQIKPKNVWKQ